MIGMSGEGSRRTVDIAVGILVGLRGCSDQEAFAELVGVVNRTGVGIFSVAASLVAIAAGSSSADDSEAFNAWGELIRRARLAPLVAAS
jgi:ANTAR domain-containing protein